MQGTMSVFDNNLNPVGIWMDDVMHWTGMTIKQTVKVTGNREQWKKRIHDLIFQHSKDD